VHISDLNLVSSGIVISDSVFVCVSVFSVCINTYIHTHIYIYIYIYIHADVCVYTAIGVYMYMHTHTHMYICTYICLSVVDDEMHSAIPLCFFFYGLG
jgi:hypothetical protein